MMTAMLNFLILKIHETWISINKKIIVLMQIIEVNTKKSIKKIK